MEAVIDLAPVLEALVQMQQSVDRVVVVASILCGIVVGALGAIVLVKVWGR